jgi:hypothetical protein
MEPDWEKIANALADALQSFLGYDGYGEGGSDDANRGDWNGAYEAIANYHKAKSS